MTQSREDKYQGFGWIRVEKYVDDPDLDWEQRYRRLEEHHIAETTFLIEEVRKLARLVDEFHPSAKRASDSD